MSELTSRIPPLSPLELAKLLEDSQRSDEVLLIDGRSFLEFNNARITDAVHMPTSTLMKRRLDQEKINITEFLHLPAGCRSKKSQVVLYDQCSESFEDVALGCLLSVAAGKLLNEFAHIFILKGGFYQFAVAHPELCVQQEPKPILTISPQPCIASSFPCGPTRIFPHLYLGSEQDAMSLDVIKTKGINYVLNVSQTCPKADFIQDEHFMRIPVNDTYSDKLICHFVKAFQFLDKVRSSNGCALVHCMAGISRSPTLAIAYVMYAMKLPHDEAYRYVKEKRPAISPNFNFLGQLVEFEKSLKSEDKKEDHRSGCGIMETPKKHATVASDQSCKRQRLVEIRSSSKNRPALKLDITGGRSSFDGIRDDLSPSTALGRISLSASAEA